MTPEQYRLKAADLHAQSQAQPNEMDRDSLVALALYYLRLAEQADRNTCNDLDIRGGGNRP